MKKVSLLIVVMLAWGCLWFIDVPSVYASLPGADGSPPPSEIICGADNGETTEGDPDDIIEGNRRTGNADEERPGGPRVMGDDHADRWGFLLRYVQLMIVNQR